MLSNKVRVVWLVLVVVGLQLAWAASAAAQSLPPDDDENCTSCHENRYYLYDSGKYFCLCEAPMHCVYCHGGRTDSYQKEIAHEGLVLYPTRENAARCQNCHTQDYLSRVVKFDAVAGIRSTPVAVVTATPAGPAKLTAGEPPDMRLGQAAWLEPWRAAGLGGVAAALLLLAFLAVRCYQLDCASRSGL
ncbi:MAG: hypothetical protein ACKOC5_00685 [Chloroflexota bacterium]